MFAIQLSTLALIISDSVELSLIFPSFMEDRRQKYMAVKAIGSPNSGPVENTLRL